LRIAAVIFDNPRRRFHQFEMSRCPLSGRNQHGEDEKKLNDRFHGTLLCWLVVTDNHTRFTVDIQRVEPWIVSQFEKSGSIGPRIDVRRYRCDYRCGHAETGNAWTLQEASDMRYAKSFIAGVCFSGALTLAFALISFALSYESTDKGGFGVTSIEITISPILLLLAFALGFVWMFRRSRI
jgi:hypothetical protein